MKSIQKHLKKRKPSQSQGSPAGSEEGGKSSGSGDRQELPVTEEKESTSSPKMERQSSRQSSRAKLMGRQPSGALDSGANQNANLEEGKREQSPRSESMVETKHSYGAMEAADGPTEAADSQPQSEVTASQFAAYPKRQYQILLTVSLLIFANSFSMLTYSVPNALCTEVTYEVEGTAAGQDLVILYLLMYPLGTLVANSLSFYKGSRACFTIGGFITLVGYACRLCSLYFPQHTYSRYNAIFAGQIFLGLAQPLVLNLIQGLANSWFSVLERDWAVKFMFAAQPIGIVAGFFLSYRLPEVGCGTGSDFQFAYTIQMVIAALAWIASLFCREEPYSPPSLSALMTKDARQKSTRSSEMMKKEMNKILRKKEIWWLAMSFFVANGYFLCFLFTPAESKMATDYNYNSQDMVAFAISYLTGGLVGSFLFGLAIVPHSYHSARKVGFILMVPATIFFDAWWHNKPTHNFPELAFFVLGFSLMPLTPLCLETASEIFYPSQDEFSSGLLFSSGTVGAITFYVIISHEATLGSHHFTANAKLCHIFLVIAGSVFAMLVYGTYERTWTESKEHLRSPSSNSYQKTGDSNQQLPDI